MKKRYFAFALVGALFLDFSAAMTLPVTFLDPTPIQFAAVSHSWVTYREIKRSTLDAILIPPSDLYLLFLREK